jgi:multiple sugar transport system ATP-binding protein
MAMCARIAILNGGDLMQVGTRLECFHQPNNPFVAGFIGEPSMNFYEMRVEGDRLVGEDFDYELSSEHVDSIGATDRVIFGIRPEDIEIGVDGTGPHQYDVVVDVVEPRGDENTVHLTFNPAAAEPETFTATVGGMRQISEGQSVRVAFPPDTIHLFDVDSGEALHNRSLETVEGAESIL